MRTECCGWHVDALVRISLPVLLRGDERKVRRDKAGVQHPGRQFPRWVGCPCDELKLVCWTVPSEAWLGKSDMSFELIKQSPMSFAAHAEVGQALRLSQCQNQRNSDGCPKLVLGNPPFDIMITR